MNPGYSITLESDGDLIRIMRNSANGLGDTHTYAAKNPDEAADIVRTLLANL